MLDLFSVEVDAMEFDTITPHMIACSGYIIHTKPGTTTYAFPDRNLQTRFNTIMNIIGITSRIFRMNAYHDCSWYNTDKAISEDENDNSKDNITIDNNKDTHGDV